MRRSPSRNWRLRTVDANVSMSGTAPQISTDQGPAPLFKTRAPRRRTCLKGVLAYRVNASTAEDFFTLDCSIRDISEGGARIILSQREPLPQTLYLIIAKYCIAYRAELVWMTYPARGLRFFRVYPMNLALPEEARFLRKIWVNLHQRDGNSPQWLYSH